MVTAVQFVDSISASPTVLLDLNTQNPFFIVENGWSAPMPAQRVTATSSALADGDLTTSTTRSDREITVVLGINATTEDAAAAAIQSLARILDAGGQWLKYQPETTAPVFFRTKRADIEQLEEFNNNAGGFKQATLAIPAEPFAYGLPESGSATINNDPTAGTNPQGFVMPAVKGDVASPLRISATPSNSFPGAAFIGSRASGGAITPVVSQAFTLESSGTYSSTSTSDTDAISGSYTAYSRTSGSANCLLRATFSAPRGDYRVIARLKSGTIGLRGAKSFPAAPGVSSYYYHDLGVVRAPSGADLKVAGFDTQTAETFTISLESPSASFGLDTVQLFPAGVDLDRSSTLMSCRPISPLIVDDIRSTIPRGAEGGGPVVVPGATNEIDAVWTFYLAATSGGTPIASANKSWTLAVDWTYYPRYLYTRPASS